MNSTCTPDISYFDTFDFLSVSLHFTSTISVPIHCLGIYCLLFKASTQMSSAKCPLVVLHVWIVLFDYTFGVMVIPFFLFPEFALCSLGFLEILHVSTLFQALLFQCAPYLKTVFILFSKHLRGKFYSNINRLKNHQQLPCLPQYLYETPVFVIADSFVYHALIVNIFVLFIANEITVFNISLVWNVHLQLKNGRMSQKTFDMQKKLFTALLIQMSVPLLTFLVPFLYAGISMIGNIYNQTFSNFAIIAISMHGLISTLVMIHIHTPYRAAAWSLFGKKTVQSGENSKKVMLVSRKSIIQAN
ncbi:hypothetical protein CRE_05572 [Caenorhabditis remanei]|uniref:Serpentine Receptor, class H n=1 Tax=Caenorhabditis remanei TaxID=31234 RepID=E3M021_CAERE|nr:hypothetical protein CRE_05572 [Caenorhabditis remanei]